MKKLTEITQKIIGDLKPKKNNRWEFLLCLLSFAIILSGIIIRIVAFLYNRSLWLDEAYLASSVVQRDFAGLLSPLDFRQGAPIGFLWIVKTFVFLFGSSEYSLRLLSLISGIGAIFMFHLVLRDVFRVARPWVGTAFLASIPYLVNYSIEFKPYMTDGFVTLLIIYLFHQVRQQKWNSVYLYIGCALTVWFSFPAIFTLAAICLFWFANSVITKSKREITISFIAGGVSLFSFLVYLGSLYTNLSATYKSPDWSLIRFPLFPATHADLETLKAIFLQYFSIYGNTESWVVMMFSIACIYLFTAGKLKMAAFLVLFELFLLLLSSWLGYYILMSRSFIFFVPLHVLLIALFLDELSKRLRRTSYVLSLIFILINLNSSGHILQQKVYRNTREVSSLIRYLESVDDKTPVYVSILSIPQYEFYSGYKSGLSKLPQKPLIRNNLIYGSKFFRFLYEKPYSWDNVIDSAGVSENAAAIEVFEKVYLLMGQISGQQRHYLLDALELKGTVTEILNVHDTPLYLYQKRQQIKVP